MVLRARDRKENKMITGIGVTLLITGLLAHVVVDNIRPYCLPWKKNLINAFIAIGIGLTVAGQF